MLERITYINHLGEELDFGTGGVYANTNELRNYSWTVTKANNKISSFTRAVSNKKLPLIIMCKESEAVEIKNKIFEIIDKDVLAEKYGKIVIGDYYLNCYITKNTKSEYLKSKRHLEVTLQVTTDSAWIKETEYFYKNNSINTFIGDYLDYSYDYSHDYGNSLVVNDINNTGITGTDFRIDIYGAVSNPKVFIGGNVYAVNTEVGSGEKLTIDSQQKTIVLTQKNGTTVNKFADRDRDYYIFEKIQPGANEVSSSGEFAFTVTLLEERSEPPWT